MWLKYPAQLQPPEIMSSRYVYANSSPLQAVFMNSREICATVMGRSSTLKNSGKLRGLATCV